MAISAFAAPILPGKLDAWKELNAQINGPRRAEFEAHERRAGLKREHVFLQQTPAGDFAIVVHEGDDPGASMGRIGASNDPFDVWLMGQVKEIHGLDVTQPPPGPLSELYISYDG